MYCDAFLAPVDIAAAFGQDRVNMETFPQGIIHHQWRRLNMNLFDELAPPFCQAGKIEKDGTAGLVAFYNKWPFEEFRNEPLKAQPLIVLGEGEIERRAKDGRSRRYIYQPFTRHFAPRFSSYQPFLQSLRKSQSVSLLNYPRTTTLSAYLQQLQSSLREQLKNSGQRR